MKYLLLLYFFFITVTSSAQQEPVINYTLTITDNDTNEYSVEMHITNVPDTFSVAMVKHFEYDDRYWRFIKDFTVTGKTGKGKIIRKDSALWKIITTGNEALLSYKIQPPVKNERGSWQPFLAANGTLTGGPHSVMYLAGNAKISSYITLNIPAGWTVATGLKFSAPNTYYAASVYELTDEPVLAGKLKTWTFFVDDVPHHIAYYPLPDAKSFDTIKLVTGIQKVVEQTQKLFGSLPYNNYTFQLIDGSYGGLEHSNSVTLGANSAELAEDFTDFFSEMAHEYFHTWNLVRIRPAEYGDVTYKNSPLSKGLWWSEGVTMFYADLLLRRAGLPVYKSSRIEHLEQLINSYYNEAGNTKISPEKASLASNADPGMLGDYAASTHVQGELLGSMIDLIIRNASDNKYALDDAMRNMMKQFGNGKGFTNKDVEQTINNVCGCNMHVFFENYIYGNKAINLNKYLGLIGLRCNIIWKDAKDDKGNLLPDLNVYAWLNQQHKLLLGITSPANIWGKAGLHTGDEIISVNDSAINTQRDFFNTIGKKNIGDTVSVKVKRQAGLFTANVIITGYKIADAKIEMLQTATSKQESLREHWLAGK